MTESTLSKASHTISALILAAGKGTRMKSTLPKVLHPVMGRSMLEWVIDVVKKAGATDITCVLSPETKPFDGFLAKFPDTRITVQKKQRGTGDAVAAAAPAFGRVVPPSWSGGELLSGTPSNADWVLICAGDTPAMNPQTIREFIQETLASQKRLAVLGMRVTEPRGYGRLVKLPDGGLKKIVEERDADLDTKKINLCNSGVIFARTDWLFELLENVSPSNSQNEYYLTDVFSNALARGESAYVFETDRALEFAGVNDRMQLDEIERSMMKRRMHDLMSQGVTVHLPDTVFIEAEVTIEPDTRIYPGVYLKGKTRISRNCVIGPQVVLEDVVLGAGVSVGAHAVLARAKVAAGGEIPTQSVFADTEL